jgi:hypothetical protein
MIDWTALFFNAFWIAGTAVVLATLSYSYWTAQATHTPWRTQFEQKNTLIPLWLGFSLISFGLMGTAPTWWETIIWLAFLLFALLSTWQTWRTPTPPQEA